MPTIEQLEALLQADPNDTFVLYALAQEHAKAGSHEDSVALYDRCLRVDPDYLYAYFHKARALEALGRVRDARDALEQGVARAAKLGDAKAQSELSSYLDELES